MTAVIAIDQVSVRPCTRPSETDTLPNCDVIVPSTASPDCVSVSVEGISPCGDETVTAHVPATCAIGPPPPAARVPVPRGAATSCWQP